jgi:hypothetical protein
MLYRVLPGKFGEKWNEYSDIRDTLYNQSPLTAGILDMEIRKVVGGWGGFLFADFLGGFFGFWIWSIHGWEREGKGGEKFICLVGRLGGWLVDFRV